MLTVDNSGRGNCMYYAYGISLMYFLRAKNNPQITDDIFIKLKLGEDQRTRLKELLAKPSHQEFTLEEIKTIVEPILGRATRNLAAEHTKVEFKKVALSSSLFSAAKYGLEYYFKKESHGAQPQLSKLIDHEFTDENYTEAEIYKVSDMKNSMRRFAQTIIPQVTEKFTTQWENEEKELKRKKGRLTEQDTQFHQALLLDQILREKTIEFFLADNDKYLDQYINHLKKEFVWGTEETLMVLHRAIQGERMERNQNGTIDTFYDTPICLHLHKNNRSPFYQNGVPEMILNNIGNAHWTSKIPEIIFDRKAKPDPEKKQPEKKQPEKKQSHSASSHETAKAKLAQQNKGLKKDTASDLPLDLDQDFGIAKALGLQDEEDEDFQKDSNVDVQTKAALDAVSNGMPHATEGFVARMVNAIKTLWRSVKNIVSYLFGQEIRVK